MMLSYLQGIHQHNAEQWFDTTCTIYRHDAGAGWSVAQADVPCSVQPAGESFSPADPDQASIDEQSRIMVYMGPDVAIQVGWRIEWDDEMWEVNALPQRRSTRWGRSAICSSVQSALPEEEIVFRRRQAGAWVDLGTFNMRFTDSVVAPQAVEGDTAASATMQSTMMGDPETDVLQVGDWFARDGYPGRIIKKDATASTHVEFEYLLEVKVP